MTQLVLHFPRESAVLCVELFVVGTLFLAAPSGLRELANSLSGRREGLGSFFGAFAAGVTVVARAKARGVPTMDLEDSLQEAVVSSTVEAVN